MLHHEFLSLAFVDEVLVHLHIGRCPQHKTHDESDAHLSHNLVTTFQSFLVVAEYLYEVVHATQEAEPQRGDNHQDEVDVAQTTEQQHWHEDRDDDYHTTHRRHTNLLYAKRIDACIACCLRNLLALQILDKLLAKPC